MLTLIWVILLFTDTGSGTSQCPKSNSSITLSDKNVSAQAGLCVVLACSVTTDDVHVENITWYKHDGKVNKTVFGFSNNTKTDPEFKGRVSLLEADLKKKNCSIIINNLTKSDSGSYHAVAKTKTHCTLIANITVTVTELSEKPTLEIPEITEGEQTTLTCSAPGLCPGSTPNITWIWSESGQNHYEIKENNTEFKSENPNAFKSTLTFNASAKHNGSQVTCKVTFKNVTINETKTLKFKGKYAPRILNDSNCSAQSKVLTCVCISEGFPSPTIKWPHLESHTEYSVATKVSNTSVTSTITVSQDHCHNSTIECVSSNSNGYANVSLIIKELNANSSPSEEKNNYIFKQFLTIIQEKKVYIAVLTGFVIGIILSTVIACLATKCRRKKWKRSENLSENLEMVTSEAGPTMDADQVATYDGIREPEDAQGEAESVVQLPSNGNCTKEVEYSDINFSALRPKNPEEAANTQATDTEYAEIKREELRQEDAQEDSEMLEGNEENELMSKKAKEEGEDVALYSSVEELMG
ncbi:sialic acid-binding Ig-like lectin 12 [Pelmatolapia mariae]|uniref:sialic acid-binding Ig-like lectin 12 n=1 Tax=Pelmatolapia mariae TaxID=158779 RepID=UPI002FE60523